MRDHVSPGVSCLRSTSTLKSALQLSGVSRPVNQSVRAAESALASPARSRLCSA
jgi:hypothetical protein